MDKYYRAFYILFYLHTVGVWQIIIQCTLINEQTFPHSFALVMTTCTLYIHKFNNCNLKYLPKRSSEYIFVVVSQLQVHNFGTSLQYYKS